jgi:hypothetical protein
MNLNLARIKLREKEYQLSSRYDRGPLNIVIIFRKRHNISERYDFDTRKHVESDLICLLRRDHKCYVFMFLCFVGACQRFFLLARFGRKTDGHTKNIRMYFKFFVFFLPKQGLSK